MMKKLLILFIVLSLATGASAVSVWPVVGGESWVDVTPGATITVDLVSDTLCSGITDGGTAGWWVTADAGITLPATGTFDPFLDNVTSNSLSRLYAASTAGSGGVYSLFSFDVTVPVPVNPEDYESYSITVNYSTMWASFFDDMGVEHYADLVSGTDLTITVIPEPMTIALLGLGGLIMLGHNKKG